MYGVPPVNVGVTGVHVHVVALEQNGLGHLFDAVMNSIQEVRNVVGGVALVTPTGALAAARKNRSRCVGRGGEGCI